MFTQGSGKFSGNEEALLEIKRQFFHLIALSLWIIPVLFFPFLINMFLFGAVIVVNFLVVRKVDPFYRVFLFFIKHLERERNLHSPSLQALFANLGVFVSYLLFGELAVGSIIILAVGDSSSTLVGKLFGKKRLFYSERKTAEGTVAFFLSVYLILFLVFGDLYGGLLASSVCALLESFDLPPDDNLLIPLVGGCILYLV
jgi:dolichol kinase